MGRYRGALPWSAWYTLRVPVITVGAASFHSLYPRLDSYRPYGALEHSGSFRERSEPQGRLSSVSEMRRLFVGEALVLRKEQRIS
jgi:hypothetical protein